MPDAPTTTPPLVRLDAPRQAFTPRHLAPEELASVTGDILKRAELRVVQARAQVIATQADADSAARTLTEAAAVLTALEAQFAPPEATP